MLYRSNKLNSWIFIKRLLNSDFVKNTIALMIGNVAAQFIAVSTSPVITRLFTPENFGSFALLTSSIVIINSFSSLCYERAILLPKKSEDALNVLFLAISLLIIVTSLTLLIVLCFDKQIAKLFENEDFATWMFLVPIGVFFIGLVKILRYWRLRNKGIKSMAFARVGDAGTSALTKILFGCFIGAYSGGLILGFFLGMLVSLTILAIKPLDINIKKNLKSISVTKVKVMSRQYRKFPYFASWNALLVNFSQNMPVLLFSSFFSPAVVGFYSLGNRILKQPVALLGESVKNIYFQKAAQNYAEQISLLSSYKKSTFALFMIGVLPFFVLAVYSKIIFGYVFGPEWGTAGLYVQIMSPLFFIMFIRVPSNVIYEVFQKQDVKLFFSIFKAGLSFLGISLGYLWFKAPLSVIGVFVLVNILIELLSIIYAYSIVRADPILYL